MHTYIIHLPLHLGYLAGAFIQKDDLQSVHLSEERETKIYCWRYSKDIYRNKNQALTIARLTHSLYRTKIYYNICVNCVYLCMLLMNVGVNVGTILCPCVLDRKYQDKLPCFLIQGIYIFIYQSLRPLVNRAGSGHTKGHLVCRNSAPPAVDRVHISESIMPRRSLSIIVYWYRFVIEICLI